MKYNENSGSIYFFVISQDKLRENSYLLDFGYIEKYENDLIEDLYQLTPKGYEYIVNLGLRYTGRLN